MAIQPTMSLQRELLRSMTTGGAEGPARARHRRRSSLAGPGVFQHERVTATEEHLRDVLGTLSVDEDGLAREPHVAELLGQDPVRVPLNEVLIDWELQPADHRSSPCGPKL
jgi:hypothetical protein